MLGQVPVVGRGPGGGRFGHHRRRVSRGLRQDWPGERHIAHEAHHEGDTYNPVDPGTLEQRLTAAGFASAEVKTNPFGWAAVARKG